MTQEKLSEYFFSKGCTVCNMGEITFDKNHFLYICKNCGATAAAHRSDTPYAKKYEPYQYLAGPVINKLRETLLDVFNQLWTRRMDVVVRDKIKNEALINIIYESNIRSLIINKELHYVKVITLNHETMDCSIFSFKTNQFIDDIDQEDLMPISNKAKTYVWLAEKLGIKPENCQIGYLSEQELKSAFSICSKELANAKQKAYRTFKNQNNER